LKLDKAIEAFFASGQNAAVSGETAVLHEFRISAKRLRYAIEILDPAGGTEWLKRLRAIQQDLGDWHDAIVAEEFLARLPARSAEARRVAAALRVEAATEIRKFQGTWRRHFGVRQEAAWIAWARTVD